jgi:CRISPR-associated protein Cas1
MIGLDPYLGVFHAIDYGRPSMALDLEEEFRPIIVDSIVLLAVTGASSARVILNRAGLRRTKRMRIPTVKRARAAFT